MSSRVLGIGDQIDSVIRHAADRHELLALLAVLGGRLAVVKEVLHERQRKDRAVSVTAAAARLGVSDDTIRQWCLNWGRDTTPGPKKLRFVQVGVREKRIPESAIDEYFEWNRGRPNH